MKTTRVGKTIVKNFGDNKGAAINYFNNICKKDYVECVDKAWNVKEQGYCVTIIYKKNK